MNGRTTFTATATELGGVTRDIRGDMFADTEYVVGKLPAPMYYQPDNKGHTDGHLVGAMTAVEFDEADRIAATVGYFLDGPDDPERIAAWAREAIQVAREGLVNPSIDAGALEFDSETDRLLRADISGMTLVGMPAMTGTSITIIDPVTPDAEADDMPADIPATEDDADTLIGASPLRRAMVAAVTEPAPASAFEQPDIDGYDPGYRIEGRRIFGHLSSANACHAAWTNECMGPPPTATGYALFARYRFATDAGEIPVGRLTTGLGHIGNGCKEGCPGECDPATADDHACAWTLSLVETMAHHDRMTTLADVAIGETDTGEIWLSGLLREGLGPEEKRVLARRVWSGDWRPAGESDELVEALALNHGRPAFTKRVKHGAHRSVVIAAAGPASVPAAPLFDAGAVHQLALRAWESREATQQLAEALGEVDQTAALAALHHIGR